jgi:hypothetical protein
MLVWLSKMDLAQQFCTWCCWGWQKAQQSLTFAVDWLDCLIGLCGLSLIVSQPFAVSIAVGWLDCLVGFRRFLLIVSDLLQSQFYCFLGEVEKNWLTNLQTWMWEIVPPIARLLLNTHFFPTMWKDLVYTTNTHNCVPQLQGCLSNPCPMWGWEERRKRNFWWQSG